MAELLIRAGRVVCPAGSFDGPGAVLIRDGLIVAAGPNIAAPTARVLDFPDCLALPGLVDFHAHPACEGSKYGVNPDAAFLSRGTTTAMSQGDAGANGWRRYGETTVAPSRTRVRLALNLSRRGEAGPGPCFENLADADVAACIQAIEAADQEGVDWIWGIAVNTSVPSCGATDPREVLRRALLAAAATNRPLLVGLRREADWPLGEQLALLRPGDVVTYSFSTSPEALVRDGRVRPEAWEAYRRGVWFDLGHGAASFDFEIAEVALAEGFFPRSLSTDGYRAHEGLTPPHDLPRVISKLIACGMAEELAFRHATYAPSTMLHLIRPGRDGSVGPGTLTPGSPGDVAVLRWNPDAAPLTDCAGRSRTGGCWEPVRVVCAGEVVEAGLDPVGRET